MPRLAPSLLALLLAALPARAEAPRVSDFVAERQERMRGMERALLALEDMAAGLRRPDPAAAAREAAEIALLAGGLEEAFADTPASRWGPASRARDRVWREPGTFLLLMNRLEDDAFALIDTARAGDLPGLAAGVAALRRQCNACHAEFMKP